MTEERPRPGSPRVSRREFIGRGALGAAALASSQGLLTACSVVREQVRGACTHDCPDTCAWIVTTENGRAVELAGDAAHPMTRGRLCDKMTGFLTDVVYNPDRVLYPLRRVGEKGLSTEPRFERVSWDEALDDIAGRLKRIVAEHGPTAVMPYSFAGTEGAVQGRSLASRFFGRLGATRLHRSICGDTAHAGVSAVMGTSTGILPEDIQKSRYIIVWGSNPVLTNPHGWPYIESARREGARLVVIDPLRTETAEAADWHLRPRPGTDAALALGMMHVIVKEELHDADYVDRYTVGFERLRERIAEYPPERVAGITGVPAGDVIALARAYATTKPSTIRLQIAMEKHSNGAMLYRSVACLPAIVGAWRHEGGGILLFTDWAMSALKLEGLAMPELEDPATRSINMVQLGQALTDPSLDPPISALIVYGSNPATIAPDQNRVFDGLRRADLLTVVLDHFVTDTARFADYVLPAATQAEYLDIVVPWGSPHVTLNVPAIEPLGEALPNTEIFRRLSRRMGFEEDYLYVSDEDLIRSAFDGRHPYLEGVTYESLRHDGWATVKLPRPFLPHAEGRFPTPSRRCELYSEALAAAGGDPLPRHVDPDLDAAERERYPLTFMSTKSARMHLNSSHANQPRHRLATGDPRLRIHPADAERRGIADGDRVRAFNARGSVVAVAQVSDATLEGVATMPHGFWASLVPGGSSANALTSGKLSDGGGGALYDARIEVEKSA